MNTPFNVARQRVEAGNPIIGTWVFARDPGVVEVVAQAGFDFIAVDMEHTALTWETVEDHVRIAQSHGISVFVRISPATAGNVGRALDIGAHGVCVPHVTVASARALAPAFRYPPGGTRGTCTAARAASHGWASFAEYASASDQGTWFIALVEDREALEGLDTLLAEGLVDVVLPGKADLSAAFGQPGSLDGTDVLAAVRAVVKRTAESPAHAAAYVTSLDEVQPSLKWGARVLFCSIDMRVIRHAFTSLVAELHSRTRTADGAPGPGAG